MDPNSIYSYEPIQHNQIRLLKFLEDENPTSATFKTFSLEEPLPSYYALSYSWTCDNAVHTKGWLRIKYEGLLVLASLQPFFQVLRSKNILLDGRWWWIDSLCIDLDNLEERAYQVRLMHHIYRQADQVIFWLGDESSDSNLAIDFIKFLDKVSRQKYSVGEIRMMLQKDEYYPKWTALINFLSRKWWSRIWTVQEFVIPTSASFWCGMQNVGRTAVCRSLSIADKCPSVGVKETVNFRYGFNRRRAWDLYKAGKKPGVNLSRSLLSLAAYFCCMDATDDRDRLYGLMALSTDESLLDVSYSLSSQEVYLRFAQAFIARYKSLDIICFASIYGPPSGSLRPSWVPDWHNGDSSLVIPSMVSQTCKTHVGNLRSPKFLEHDTSIYYSASGKRAAVYEFQGSTLFARGVIVDTVDGLAGSRDFAMTQSSAYNSKQLSDCSTSSPTEIIASVCKSLVLDRKDRFLRYAMPTEEFLQDFVRLCAPLITESHSSAPKELREWFRWTRSLEIHGRSFESILRDNQQVFIDSPGSAPNQDEFIFDSFYGRFFDIVVRLSFRLMVSCNGRIGMVSEKAMKGDLVCVLFGCSVPVLLRKSEHGDSFTFVGECFLDGY
ncbi:hypothetical protein NUW58_g2233 [Xylaria curta]|uniref:Uncharacterized protein n=1 Tax=Xylaria curta TaxID=42375 RepID=A0ACC1PJS7_9PEZI|nr:hypothetical protein NUW58_g2233 [Xylaria curta]